MLCIQWWACELRSLLSDSLGELHLGAQFVVDELLTLMHMTFTGYSVAAHIQAGSPQRLPHWLLSS